MSYRKVTYAEQIWYIIRFWLRQKFKRKEKSHEDHSSERPAR